MKRLRGRLPSPPPSVDEADAGSESVSSLVFNLFLCQTS